MKNETRSRKARRAPVDAAWTASIEEHTESVVTLQTQWLSRRLGLTPERARLVASLVFDGGRA